ncbi:MAG: CBS domain-containing protein [Nitrosopumilaceae archaeon]|uniref:CBS domain-containing protein n=2 Tax=Candidatus Nitrosomaritimum aestuariumsis TaxID=3342354 RepID=A0AC60W078_9ARCH|nr:CBS domain-containing protein [Nitrosopumilaceae archaeon]MBA4454178.1 CBS domain-containing protein [Nitrosopumilaceae archaeon]MBA4459683.1 CBS domain-containing protein [Nitrosopumilaceae archaeon]
MNATSSTMQLWIEKVMDDSVLSVNSTVSSYDAAKLMEESKAGAIVVLENQIPTGIVTNTDLAVKIIAHSYPVDTPIRRIMSSPLISISPETDMKTASELMTLRKIRKLPVIDNDQVIGMIVASKIAEPNH